MVQLLKLHKNNMGCNLARIDEIKEELNYLKIWLGIVVVTAISLIGWLINNYALESSMKIFGDIIAIIVLTIAIIIVDKKIKNKIKSLRDL